MINADEHKKLLAQIAELEKNSVNYFDVEKEFFLIDSNNLSQVRPRFYGYSIQRSGIYEDDDLTPEAIAGLDGRGCYIYVDVKGGKITIKQDLNGCWGIYLFRHGDYFALSNSFFRLLDHIKFRYPLTVNRDYCNYFLVNDLCSHAYSETAVNEIQLIDRSAIIQIDIAKKNLESELIDYREYTISLDSPEGIATLDRWFELWSEVLHGIAQHTKFIRADLTGGFDSRISFIPLLHSGIDLNKIQVFSIKGDLHTFKEDYEIANKIAEYYGFQLNKSLPANQYLNFTLLDAYNLDFHNRQTVHKYSAMFSPTKKIEKHYFLNGYGGEIIRGYWHASPDKFVESQSNTAKRYSSSLFLELSHSIETIINSAFCRIRDKYKIEDKESIIVPQYFYEESRCRSHFGKGASVNYLQNTISLSPTFDPEIRTLCLNTLECPDLNLLMAVIFTRYEPDLLKFPFQGKRSIASETIEYAQKINERFPLVKKDKTSISGGGIFHLQPRDKQTEKILLSGHNNPNVPKNLSESCLKAAFKSSRTFGLFTAYFDEEFYHYAKSYYENNLFARFSYISSVVGITKVLANVEVSQRNQPPYQGIEYFLKQDFAKIHESDSKVLLKFSRYFTSRVDIRFVPKTAEGDFQILSTSDNRAQIIKPLWLNKDGVGYMITSYIGNLEFVAKATTDGRIHLNLMGLDIHIPEDKSKRIPYWIDYTKFIVNGKVVFDKLTPAWHDKYYRYSMDVKAGEEIKIQVEWLPHRSDTGT